MSIATTLGWAAAKRIGKRLLITGSAKASVLGLKGLAITGLVGLLSTAAVGGYQQVRIWSRDAQIGRNAEQIAALQTSNAELEASVAIQAQAIAGLRLTAIEGQRQADRRVELAQQASTERRRNAQQAGSGPAEMNQWMHEQFPR